MSTCEPNLDSIERVMNTKTIKANGIHYTPTELAAFLASAIVEQLSGGKPNLAILDPACGDGALLFAIAEALPSELRARAKLVGYEMDCTAIEQAKSRLERTGVAEVQLNESDFLNSAAVDAAAQNGQLGLFEPRTSESERFDVIIANPPYVRTQVLGSLKAQELARRFGLKGRVDLYHAFTKAMAAVLKPGGVLGLLTSNRFLTIKSGASLRHLLRNEFDLRAVFDLGDTRLFSAAVLPVIVIGQKLNGAARSPCIFNRVYENRLADAATQRNRQFPSVLDAVRQNDVVGDIATAAGTFHIERGFLAATNNADVWSLSTDQYDEWLNMVRARQFHSFDDVARIRVGIKTTADEVFIREEWDSLFESHRPEPELIKPLITHRDACRWANRSPRMSKSVFYPYRSGARKRVPIALTRYPGARTYLERFRERLTRRRYVVEGGREWFEIWVPHSPADWDGPKIVFPDISEEPRSFIDKSGAVVNGDCYWMTLRDGFDADWLLLMLAVANSTFITRYYDIAFHNKLYSGRRRFMTQYVKEFPLPDLSSTTAKRIVKLAAKLVSSPQNGTDSEVDELVWQAFGLTKEVKR
jgi:adenine-specific DNA-methyltransferase